MFSCFSWGGEGGGGGVEGDAEEDVEGDVEYWFEGRRARSEARGRPCRSRGRSGSVRMD